MRITVIILLLLTGLNIYGQINVGSNELVRKRPGKFKHSDLKLLKNSKTLFIYRDSDLENLELFKSTLQGAWDYTEMEFISYDDFVSQTWDESYSFFTFGGIQLVNKSSSGMQTTNTYIYLLLWMKKDGEQLNFSRIEMFPTFPTITALRIYSWESYDSIPIYLYKKSIIRNWNIGYLKNALQFVNKKLNESEENYLFKNDISGGISHLVKDTLYIPDYVLIKFGIFDGNNKRKHKVKRLLRKYSYPYKIVSQSELSQKIVQKSAPVYYLSYIKSSTDKFITVINGITGDMVYNRYKAASYNIHKKDFKKLNRKVKIYSRD